METHQASEKPRILTRFLLLSGLGVFGAICFVPSLLASATPRPSNSALSLFVVLVSLICIVASWFGLLLADAAGLPMSYLRLLDRISETPTKGGFLVSAVFGVVFAVASIFVLRFFHLPNLGGPLWSRIASVFFAAGSLEIVIHLFLMSLVVRLSRGRIWAGIVVAASVFVAFHLAGLSGQTVAVVEASALLNGVFGLGLGFLYARYGFEYVVFCHAIAHFLAVSLA